MRIFEEKTLTALSRVCDCQNMVGVLRFRNLLELWVLVFSSLSYDHLMTGKEF